MNTISEVATIVHNCPLQSGKARRVINQACTRVVIKLYSLPDRQMCHGYLPQIRDGEREKSSRSRQGERGRA